MTASSGRSAGDIDWLMLLSLCSRLPAAHTAHASP
jgi:hypothetical protein